MTRRQALLRNLVAVATATMLLVGARGCDKSGTASHPPLPDESRPQGDTATTTPVRGAADAGATAAVSLTPAQAESLYRANLAQYGVLELYGTDSIAQYFAIDHLDSAFAVPNGWLVRGATLLDTTAELRAIGVSARPRRFRITSSTDIDSTFHARMPETTFGCAVSASVHPLDSAHAVASDSIVLLVPQLAADTLSLVSWLRGADSTRAVAEGRRLATAVSTDSLRRFARSPFSIDEFFVARLDSSDIAIVRAYRGAGSDEQHHEQHVYLVAERPHADKDVAPFRVVWKLDEADPADFVVPYSTIALLRQPSSERLLLVVRFAGSDQGGGLLVGRDEKGGWHQAGEWFTGCY